MMKRFIFLFLTLLTFPLSAFDWGGFFDNNTAYKGELNNINFDNMSLEQTDRLTLWFRARFNPFTYLTAEGFYEFGYSSRTKSLSHKIDLSLLKFNRIISNTTMFNIGRYGIRDLSGIIISQPSDGIEVIHSTDSFSLGAYIGFTGLLNNMTVDINGGTNRKTLSPVYTLAPPFILAGVTMQLPYLFGQQSVAADFYAAIDVDSGEDKTHRMYMTALLNGLIGDSLFYIFSTSLGLTKATNNKWQVSNLTALEISTYLPFFSSMLSWKTMFATGPQGNNEGFQTFTVATANMDETLNYAGNIKTGIVGTLRPIDSLLLFTSVDVFFNVMDDTAKKGYVGIQWMFSTCWQIVSDVQLAFSAGQFSSAESGTDSYMLANLKVLISF